MDFRKEVTCECSKNVSVADIFLRAQFIRGIKDSWIKEQLVQSELTDFNALVDKAIALETSKIDGRELSKSTTTTIDDINKVSKRSRNRQSNDIKTSFRNRNTNQRDFATNYRRKSKKPSLDFEILVINNLCLRCGHNSHLSRDCRSNPNNLKCKACKSTGHVQKVCIKILLKAHRSNSPTQETNYLKTYQDIGVNTIIDIYDNRNSGSSVDSTKYFIYVKIENCFQKFEVDTGAAYTLIPNDQFQKLGIKRQLEPTRIAFRSYTENVFVPLGKVQVKVEHKGQISNEDLYVVPDGFEPLLGRIWIRHLKINLNEIDQNIEDKIKSEVFSIQNISDIERHFPQVFEQKKLVLQRSPDSEITMKLLNDIFATHGYPLFMVSDNASIFTSEEFKYFCRMNGIRQKFIAPGHPATNGLAERNFQTLKDRLKLMSSENVPINLKVQRILFRYRATPLANGKSPAEMYLNRKIRIRLDAMFPFCERKSEQLIKPSTRIIKVGRKDWKLGVVTQKLCHLHYIVKLDDGREVKRHINQMQKSEVQNEEVISNAPTSDLEPFLNQDCDPGHYQFIKPSTTQRNSSLRRSTRVRRPPAYLQDYDRS
ncbi:unnamed protein product [Larinioides sclopetarius]|uniref:Endonuclease n=1 Tax=Larinioides sclopetarius TaxID=280406 RepID=A0AAV1ZE83_9ARAC